MNGQTRTKNILKFLAIIFSGIGLLALFVAGIFLIRNEAKITIENQSIILADSSGTCGANLTWTLDSNGVLTISGTGDMDDYEYYEPNYHPWDSNNVKEIIIENGIMSIGNYAFYECEGLTSINIPESVESIGESAFAGCNNLATIEIPDSVTSIEWSAFNGCSDLTSVNIPSGVTNIDGVFQNCSGLISINIPRGVTSLESAFGNCSSLTSIVVDSENTVYSDGNGSNCIIETATNKLIFGCQNTIIPNSVTSIGLDAFSGCSSLTTIIIPNSVTSIGWRAFYRCQNLISIEIPNSVTSIGNEVFESCTNLRSVTILSNVTSIPNFAFLGCGNLRRINIPNSVASIGDGAFSGCSSLTSIDIPSSVTGIGTYTFSGMASSKIIFKSLTVPSIGSGAFGTNASNTVNHIFVPNSALEDYKAAENWSNYVSIMEGYDPEEEFTVTFKNYNGATLQEEQVVFAELPVYNGVAPTRGATSEYVYEFDGWDKNIEYVTEDTTYTATYRQSGSPYVITYNSNYETIDEETQDVNYGENFTTYENSTFERNGYRIMRWDTDPNGSGTSYPVDTEMTYSLTDNLTLYAQWEAIEYVITTTVDGVDTEQNYTIESADITLINPIKDYYNFIGWTGLNSDEPELEVVILQGSTGDRKYVANWTPIVYTISYTLDGGEVATANPTSYTIESDEFTLNNPTKEGYTFLGWTGSNGSNPETTVTVTTGTTGDLTYTANWTAIDYYLTYDLNGGSGSITDANAHHITDVVTLTDAEPTKNGYEFNGWKYNNATVTQVTFGADDITVVADWTPTVYTISYTLNNGSGTFKGNYTIEETFTLNVPTRTAYDFVGWTGSNGDEPEIEVTVEEGTTGDLSYTANWTPTVYGITYNLSGGSTDNPLTYTIEDATFTLSEPTREGYRFVGWTGSNGEEEQMVVTINHGTYGEKTYTAHWIVLAYSIRLTVDGVQSTQYYSIESGEITLENPTKDGYEFIGWTGSNGDEPELVVTIPTGNTENKAYTANWEVIEYTITYNLYGGSVATTNPESYTIEDEEIILTNPTRTGYEFIGWTGSNGDEAQLSVTIPAGSMGDKEYSANWEEISYTITMIIDGVSSTITYAPSSDDITLVNPEKNGYTFVGWTGSNGDEPELVVVILSGSSEDKEYVANWEIANYTITKIIDGVETTQTYTMFDSDIEIVNPTKDGYEFIGWTGSNGNEPELVVVISAGSYGDKTYTANWAQIYTITYNLDDGVFTTEYPENFTANSEDITLIAPSKRAYSFVGWTGSNGNEPELVVTIPAGSTGDKEYTAIWSPIEYTITYNLYGGTSTNPLTYTIEDDDIVLVAPTKDGCDFTGWTGNNGSTPQLSVTIPAGSTGNKEYTAHWVFMTYTITYTLNGGSASNIGSYTVESEGFTLNNPSKTGYTFLGWTGSNGDEPEIEVTIPTGSIGNRSYIANFEPTVYTISYNLNGGSGENPASYTIESPKITLAKPTKNGYTFKGWTGSNGSVARETVTIASGSTGNKEYTANWTIVKYNLTYTLNGGTLSTSNPKTYTVEDEDIVLNNPSKTGYTFVGWTGANGDVPQTNTVISTGSTGAKSFVANFEIINYEIDYDLGGGSAENPDAYTILSDDFTLSNPTRYGYEFVGWTGSNGAVPELEITIARGSTGNKNFKANWELVTYTITVSIDEEENIKEYTIESDDIALVEPIREGYTFLGWTGSNGNVPQHDIVVETGNFGNKEYTANFEEIVYKITLIIGDEQEIQNYTINSETITLEEPIRDGYRFVGWTGSNGTAPEMVVQIEKGNIGGKVYFANFELIDYVIVMTIDGRPYEINYSVESEDIKLSNPVKEGYTFLGWSTSDDPEIKEEVIISNGNFGNKEYIANWSLNQYTIKLHIDNEVKTSNYNILTPTQTIAKPSKKGYKFTGWLGANLTEKTVDLVIEQGSTGDREYFATWEELPKSTIGLIVGPVIGGVIFIAGVVVLILLLIKKKESKITK